MKTLIALIMITTACYAGLEESKQWYEAQKEALQSKYVARLKLERRRALTRGDTKEVVDLQKEIDRLEADDIKPLVGTYKITYSTGVRNYTFDGKKIYFIEGKEEASWKWTDKRTLVIAHKVGAVETWTKTATGFSVVFITPEKRRINGNAVLREAAQ